MVDRYVVQTRLAKIREYLTLLRRIRRLADERHFVKDPLIYGNAERYLQLAIQAVLDVSHHIVADKQLGLPADSKEVFGLLATHKVLSPRLSKKLTSMAGFRNVLVHEYLEIDRRRVYRALKEDLRDFEQFIKAVSKLL
ncbi:MAG: hypothetical protein A3G76_07745 [Acidobacteria bacterium RIFCSPLOWO2_12_FULL_65_11]|nr:MAG: hypothetical protein A3H95_01045 [Acidobacteria bacterium RIFCSPLOWO2_02_FULL_64_15]OFW31820.1 MAG: hypothetical protein A3G76_07745 [Acidobacteria bacterium RIFCSPLOWO2_12_FULL_65_11]